MHVLGPGGAEHESLTIRSNLADNLADLGLETHIQHAVGFVKDKVSDPAQVRLVRLEHVNKTSGGGDNNLDTALEIPDLGALGRATIDGSVANPGVGAKMTR